MKTLIVCVVLAVASAAPREYKTLDDNFDFTKLSKEEIGGVATCFMDQAPCNDLLNSYKHNFATAINEECEYCNESQKRIARVYFGRLSSQLPELYEALKTYFDPQDVHFAKFLAAIQN